MVILKFPERIKPSFRRYIGIDYSGAETPDSSLKGIRVYQASRESLPVEAEPPPSPRKYWTRRGLAEWLAERLSEDVPTLVGIDHGFSFPLRYFEVHWLEPDWQDVPRRLSEALADRRRTHLRRFYPGRFAWQRRGPFRQRPLAADHRRTRGSKVCLSFRRTRIGGQVNPCRASVAALSAAATGRPCPFLALRRMGHPCWQVRPGRGLPFAVEQELPAGKPHAPISTTPMWQPPGCARPIWMATSSNSSSPVCCPANTTSPGSRGGSLV